MVYKDIEIVSEKTDDFFVELKFEAATARAEGCEVLRINISESKSAEDLSKNKHAVTKALRFMKQKGTIQFFAFTEDFEKHTTEAVFLLNKYPLCVESAENGSEYLYLKL